MLAKRLFIDLFEAHALAQVPEVVQDFDACLCLKDQYEAQNLIADDEAAAELALAQVQRAAVDGS